MLLQLHRYLPIGSLLNTTIYASIPATGVQLPVVHLPYVLG